MSKFLLLCPWCRVREEQKIKYSRVKRISNVVFGHWWFHSGGAWREKIVAKPTKWREAGRQQQSIVLQKMRAKLPSFFLEKEEEKKRQRKTWNRSNHNDRILQMSDGNIKRKKEGNGDSSKSNNYPKHLPAALVLAATRLCALHAVHCLQKTEGWALVTTPLCFKCSRENQNISDVNDWQRIKCSKQHLMWNRKVRPEKEKQKAKKSKKENKACGKRTSRPLVDSDPKHISVSQIRAHICIFCKPACNPW